MFSGNILVCLVLFGLFVIGIVFGLSCRFWLMCIGGSSCRICSICMLIIGQVLCGNYIVRGTCAFVGFVVMVLMVSIVTLANRDLLEWIVCFVLSLLFFIVF